MGIIYKLESQKGIYYGKLAKGNPLLNHLQRLGDNKFLKALGDTTNTKSGAKTVTKLNTSTTTEVDTTDTNAVTQLEQQGLDYVLVKGFHPGGDNAFITSVAYTDQTNLKAGAYDGMDDITISNNKSNSRTEPASSVIQLAGACDELAYIEALVIMCAAYHPGIKPLHNTQVDFLYVASQILNPQDVMAMLTPNAFQARINKTMPQREAVFAFYEIKYKIPHQRNSANFTQHIVDMVLSHESVTPILAARLNEYISLNRSLSHAKDPNKKKELEATINQITDHISAGKSGSVIEFTSLASKLSEIMNNGIKTAELPTLKSIHDNYKSYIRSITNKVAHLFQSYCPEDFKVSQYNSLSRIIRSQFENGEYVKGHGAQFYAEQMSIYYGELFGPLEPINQTPTALGEYEFGRKELKKGRRIRKLFTAKPESIKDDIHKPERMTIY